MQDFAMRKIITYTIKTHTINFVKFLSTKNSKSLIKFSTFKETLWSL